jgi:hypothetical protein
MTKKFVKPVTKKPAPKKRIRWIKFNATKDSVCPVPANTLVMVKFKGRNPSYEVTGASIFYWGKKSDITHYAIVRKAPKKSTVSRTLAADTSEHCKAENSTPTAAHTASARNTQEEVTPQVDIRNRWRDHYEEAYEICMLICVFLIFAAAAFKHGWPL